MKKHISLLLTVVMLISLLPMSTTAKAQEVSALEVSCVQGNPGEQITVTVSLKNNPGFGGIAYDVYYDNSVLELVSYELHIGAEICTDSGIDTYPSRMNFQYAGTSNITGDGVLVSLVFEIISTAPCTTEVEAIPEEGTTFYYEGRKEIDFTLEKSVGTVTVTLPSCPHIAKTEVPSKSADCVNSGNNLYFVCDSCGLAFKADGVTETTVEAEMIPSSGHAYEVVIIEPTCTEQGFTIHTCHCGECYVDTYVLALGHSFTHYISDGNATCAKDGTETAKCDRCDETHTRVIVGSREDAEHSFPLEYTPDGNADCDTDGTKSRVCPVCGEKETVTDIGSALGHDYDNWVITKEATCEADGEERRECSRCGDTQTRILPMLTHSYESVVTVPTCTEKGFTTHTCSKCGDSYVDSYVDAIGHNFEDGTCSNCGEPEKKYLRGDVDLDGDVDVDDVLALLWNVLFPDMYPIEAEADFDGNGAVDVDDVLALLWHVLFPDMYPI